MADTAIQRLNMVESQVRPSDVVDRRIPSAMLELPRESFVPEASQSVAYMDELIRVGNTNGNARFLLPPRILAKMIQHLELEPTDLVLDVGCASGYGTAVIARIAQTVVGLECDAGLAEHATAALAAVDVDNAAVITGSLPDGHAPEGPYDAILINGAVSELPAPLLDQLKDGGRLVAIMLEDGFGRCKQWRRLDQTFDNRWLFDAAAPLLPGFEPVAEFVF